MKKEKKQDAKGSTSLREEIFEMLSIELRRKEDKPTRSVMTRLSAEYIEILDALVRLEIFKSRSEAIAAIVMKTFNAEIAIFQELKEQAKKQDEMQEKVKSLAMKALRE